MNKSHRTSPRPLALAPIRKAEPASAGRKPAARKRAPDPAICRGVIVHEDIVSRVRKAMPDDAVFYSLAGLYKMFADSTRVRVMWALSCEEMCVCDLATLLGMTKSAVSHQLKSLRLTNLIKYRKEGKSVYYSLADNHVRDIFRQGFRHIKHS